MTLNKFVLYKGTTRLIYYFNKVWYFSTSPVTIGDKGQWLVSANAHDPRFVEAFKVYTNVFDESDDI
jgi:hypothetical protein